MKPGTQIIYIPTHANGDTDHPDAEAGFVTSNWSFNARVYCRYWSKHEPNELRTKANSESTPVARLIKKDTRPQSVVNTLIEELYELGGALVQ